MLFVINSSATSELKDIVCNFQFIASSLSDYLALKDFGNDIEQIYVGLICVSQEYRSFFKLKKDRYTKKKREYIKDGFKISIEKAFEMEIELPYSILLNSTMSDAIAIIATQILDSLERLKSCKNLDFNTDDLISEVRSFFKLNNCIQ